MLSGIISSSLANLLKDVSRDKLSYLFLLVPLIALSCLPVQSEEPPKDSFSTKPILRIETGMHTAMIKRIAMDAKQRYLVTASYDKTLRVWDMTSVVVDKDRSSSSPGASIVGNGRDRSLQQTMRLQQTIRPPIGEGNEGKLYAVAMSPDGEWIAAGGWTGDWDNKQANATIYLFQRSTGKLIRKINGLPQAVMHLSFSPEGKYLTANLASGGIRVFAMKTEGGKKNEKIGEKTISHKGIKQIYSDSEYGSRSMWSEWKKIGIKTFLATTCFDGYIRIYELNDTKSNKNVAGNAPTISIIQKIKTQSVSEPYSLAWSPDGTEIAVGYNDSTKVDIYTSPSPFPKNGEGWPEVGVRLFSPDTTGIDNGNLSSVTYSGKNLAAGGNWDVSGQSPIRIWSDLGKGKYKDIPASSNTIMDILPFSKGFVYGVQDPAIGILDKKGKRSLFLTSGIADFRIEGKDNGIGNLRINSDGNQIQFQYTIPANENSAIFDLQTRSILTNVGTPGRVSLQSTVTESPNLKIENWLNKTNPTLNGQSITLKQYEPSCSLAIHPEGNSFLLGTEWYLRFYDQTGKELWKNPVPGIAWAVNISGDGKLAIAAFGDGTIRWYRISDGKELLAFFPHNDRKRWVLWSPGGYYDASVGGEELIGWHVNRAKDKESDFFPVSKFRDTYFRPDIISRILELGDEEKAITKANEELKIAKEDFTPKSIEVSKSMPSVLTVLSPTHHSAYNSKELKIELEIRSPSLQKVEEIKVYKNENELITAQTIDFTPKTAEETKKIKFTIGVPLRQTLLLSFVSETENGVGSDPVKILLFHKNPKGEKIKPNLYILSIGVAEYKDKGVKSLNYSDDDAKDFIDLMKKQEGKNFEKINSELLLVDSKASREEIIESISALKEKIKQNERESDVTMIFVSGHGRTDADGIFYFLPYDYNTQKKASSALSGADLMTQLSTIKGKKILFMDACYSGNLTAGSLNLTRFLQESQDSNKKFVVFASSAKYEESLENKDWKNGAFTKAIKEAILEGKGVYSKNKITIKSLDVYLTKRVPEITSEKQTPISVGTGEDFPIAEWK